MNEYSEDILTIKRSIEKREKGITGFLKRLEKKGEISGSGEVGGPDAKVKYDYSVKLGLETKDFPIRRSFHPRQRESIWAKKWGIRRARWEARLKKRDKGKNDKNKNIN